MYVEISVEQTFNNKVKPDIKIKFYKTTADPVLLYDSRTLTMTVRFEKIQPSAMTFLRDVNDVQEPTEVEIKTLETERIC